MLYKLIDGYPIVLATNRDERIERAADKPEIIEDDEVRIIAPRDRIEGEKRGLYTATNLDGVVVSITNRVSDVSGEGYKSRGLLVLKAASQSSALEVRRAVEEEVRTHQYNNFNLLYADRETAGVLHYDSEQGQLVSHGLGRGVHVLTYTYVNDIGDERINLGLELLHGIEALQIDGVVERLKQVCSTEDICRPSTLDTNIIAIQDPSTTSRNRYWHCNRTESPVKYKDFSEMFL